MMSQLTREQWDQLAESDNVTLRARTVIARWLLDNYGDISDDFMAAAGDLIRTMGEADLMTYIGADLHDFIERRGKFTGIIDSAQSAATDGH